jgi:hypothetical protein
MEGYTLWIGKLGARNAFGGCEGRVRCGSDQARRPPLRRVPAFFLWGAPPKAAGPLSRGRSDDTGPSLLPLFTEVPRRGVLGTFPIGALGGSHSPGPVPVAATGVDRGRLQSGVAEAQNNRARCAARRLYQPTMLATAINAPVMSTKEPPITWSEIRSHRLARSVSSDAQNLREMSVITAATKM